MTPPFISRLEAEIPRYNTTKTEIFLKQKPFLLTTKNSNTKLLFKSVEAVFMWTRCKGQQGYTLLEMLVSFSMLLLLTGTIIPLYVQMKEAEKKQYVSYQADAILHEELLKYKYEAGYKRREKIVKENVAFYLKWNGESTQKLCVEWTDSAEKMKKKCDVMLK